MPAQYAISSASGLASFAVQVTARVPRADRHMM
jgi:hypothetical protein